MTLREILKGKNNIRIKEYERWGDGLIFVGDCYYADNRFIAIDGSFYSYDLEVNAYEWDRSDVLMIIR